MIKSTSKYCIYFLLVFTLLFSCRSLKPEKPEEKYINEPKIISWVNIPVAIPLSKIQDKLNLEISDLIYQDTSGTNRDNGNIKIKVWKRSPIKVTGQNE